jgi:hypothetical protein
MIVYRLAAMGSKPRKDHGYVPCLDAAYDAADTRVAHEMVGLLDHRDHRIVSEELVRLTASWRGRSRTMLDAELIRPE